jgi:hypothetical protein
MRGFVVTDPLDEVEGLYPFLNGVIPEELQPRDMP